MNLEPLNIKSSIKPNASYLICFLFLISVEFLSAQPDSIFFKKDKSLDVPTWSLVKNAGLTINQVSFTNWNAGGVNSISATIFTKTAANYKYKHMFWNSSLNARYGINKQENSGIRKTDDLFEIISNFGYQQDTLSNWYASARFSFSTQFSNGYNYPDTSTPISQLMAPGYLFFGLGVEYGKRIQTMSIYASPLTLKTTFVLDTALANQGAFGVEPAVLDEQGNVIRSGRKIRRELGILLANSYMFEPFENVKVRTVTSLYTDYVNNFGNIDVDWEVVFDFKVNDYIRATFGSHIRYDDDIKTTIVLDAENDITEERGAKVQWRQLLGIGVAIDF